MSGLESAGAQAPARGHAPVDLARLAVKCALERGAQQAAAQFDWDRNATVRWRDGKMENLSQATTRGLTLRLFVEGRYSVVSTNDLRPAAITLFVANTVKMTRALSADRYRGLAEPARYAGQPEIDLDLADPRNAERTLTERRLEAEAMEVGARSVPGHEAILSVTTEVIDGQHELVLVTSNGFEGMQRGTSSLAVVTVSAKDGEGRRPEDAQFAAARFGADMPEGGAFGRDTARRALDRRGARRVSSGRRTMIVDNRVGGRLTSFLLDSLAGGALQQKRSIMEGKLGQAVGSTQLSFVDDPHLRRGLRSRLFDEEGTACTPRPVFERGVLRTYFLDTYYARKLEQPPTSGSMSNLIWTPGEKTQDELCRDVKDAILVTNFLGGNANSTTGDFSMGCAGFVIRNGRRAEAVSEINVSGNHRDLWRRLAQVGSDPFAWSPLRIPTLVFEDVQFSGT
jgi:PmbA protein